MGGATGCLVRWRSWWVLNPYERPSCHDLGLIFGRFWDILKGQMPHIIGSMRIPAPPENLPFPFFVSLDNPEIAKPQKILKCNQQKKKYMLSGVHLTISGTVPILYRSLSAWDSNPGCAKGRTLPGRAGPGPGLDAPGPGPVEMPRARARARARPG